MTTSASGTVVDAGGTGLKGLTVVLDATSKLFDVQLGNTETVDGGQFSLAYADDLADAAHQRHRRLRVRHGRHLLKEVERVDVPTPQQEHMTFDPIQVERGNAESRLATLGGTKPSRVTKGNAIRWLCDNVDGWGRVVTVIRNAENSLDIMQLEIDVKPFNQSEDKEEPRIILEFGSPVTMANPRRVGAPGSTDVRIERLILTKRPIPVRIQIPWPTLDHHAIPALTLAALGLALTAALGAGAIVKAQDSSDETFLFYGLAGFALLVVFVFGAAKGASFIYDLHRTGMFAEKELAKWFEDAQATNVRVRPFHSQMFSLTHTKMVVADGPVPTEKTEAVLLGSPFTQGYFDEPAHALNDPRRGRSAGKGPIHEMSISVRGPAVGYLLQLFDEHWELAEPSDPPPRLVLPPAVGSMSSVHPVEHPASVQVVRTLNPGTFKGKPEGERGVLESYLRAIHFAERFIYIENQYFNNDAITDALVDALKAKKDLELIFVGNVEPDIPFYPHWQRSAIKTIADCLGDDAKKRFGAFTTWTHVAPEPPHHPKPRLRNNYLHTKSALIDNDWASVGSANLDGASLDYFQVAHPLHLGDMVNTETNCVVFSPSWGDNPPAERRFLEPAVDALRRELWAEHLGLEKGDPELAAEAAGEDPRRWVPLWHAQAEKKVKGLREHPNDVQSIHVLPYPLSTWWVNPEDHLEEMELDVSKFELVEHGPRSFDFRKGFPMGRP